MSVCNDRSERRFIVVHRQVLHPAAGLDIQPAATTSAAVIILYRLPTAARRHTDTAEVVIPVFGEFLDMEEGPELDGFKGAITVLSDLDVCLALIAFTHFVGGDAIVFGAVQEHDHICVLFDS